MIQSRHFVPAGQGDVTETHMELAKQKKGTRYRGFLIGVVACYVMEIVLGLLAEPSHSDSLNRSKAACCRCAIWTHVLWHNANRMTSKG